MKTGNTTISDGGMEGWDSMMKAVYYVIKNFPDSGQLDIVRLGKILWFADRDYYKQHFEVLSGMVYIRKDKGPFPKQLMKLIDELVEKGVIKIEKPENADEGIPTFKLEEKNGRFNEEEIFEPEEKEYLDNAIKSVGDRDIRQVVAETHDHVYRMATKNGEIPMFAFLN